MLGRFDCLRSLLISSGGHQQEDPDSGWSIVSEDLSDLPHLRIMIGSHGEYLPMPSHSHRATDLLSYFLRNCHIMRLQKNELWNYIQGETVKVLTALKAVLGYLRRFLVDHSILPLFEKSLVTPAAQDHAHEPWTDKKQSLINSAQQTGPGNDYSRFSNWDSLLDRRPQISQTTEYSPDLRSRNHWCWRSKYIIHTPDKWSSYHPRGE